jgi:hypothetical protein
VYNTHVSDIIFSIFAHNHELTFPQFLVIGNLVVACFTFADFENSRITFELPFEALKLLSVDRQESHTEFAVVSFVCYSHEWLTDEIRVLI